MAFQQQWKVKAIDHVNAPGGDWGWAQVIQNKHLELLQMERIDGYFWAGMMLYETVCGLAFF